MTRRKTTNVAALARWLTVERRAAIPAALVQLAESLAAAVDRDSQTFCAECKRSGANAALWREYRITLGELATASGGDDDGEETPLAKMRTAVADAPVAKPKKPRAGSSSSSRKPRAPADAVAKAGGGRRPRAPR